MGQPGRLPRILWVPPVSGDLSGWEGDELVAARTSGITWAVRTRDSHPHLLLHPACSLETDGISVSLIQHLACLAVVEAVDALASTRLGTPTDSGLRIKWPNDVYHGAQKLGGVLCESSLRATGEFTLVFGVGLNVTNAQPSTCVRDVIRGLPGAPADASGDCWRATPQLGTATTSMRPQHCYHSTWRDRNQGLNDRHPVCSPSVTPSNSPRSHCLSTRNAHMPL